MLSWCVAITIFGIVCFDLECVFKKKMHSLILAFTDRNIVGPILSKENRLPVAPIAHLSPQKKRTD